MSPDNAVLKPSRGYTKRLTLVNNALAWSAIGGAMALGQEMAMIIVPLMVVLIASLLGIYQGVGHFDLRALAGRRTTVKKRTPVRPPRAESSDD
ncbi:MAG: hypothetical protein K2X10_10330 [Hyphomicrobiales bacterium]|nr:hypothetical protein [Hyphomicrobiales bacterium]